MAGETVYNGCSESSWPNDRWEGYRMGVFPHEVPIIKGMLAGEPWEAPLTVSQLPTRAQLTEIWCYCQAKSAQKAEATALLARGVAMVERLTSLMTDSDSLQAALLFPLVEAGIISQPALSADFSPAITALIQGVAQISVIEPLNFPQQPLTAVQWSQRRRLLFATMRDVRCVMIKLVERIVYIGRDQSARSRFSTRCC